MFSLRTDLIEQPSKSKSLVSHSFESLPDAQVPRGPHAVDVDLEGFRVQPGVGGGGGGGGRSAAVARHRLVVAAAPDGRRVAALAALAPGGRKTWIHFEMNLESNHQGSDRLNRVGADMREMKNFIFL